MDQVEQWRKLKGIVDRAGELPAVPEIVSDVLRLTEDPSADMQEMTQVIQRDPALTAKILRISNSAYYGLRQHVGTLQLAVLLLGMTEVRNIVLSVSVFDNLRDAKTDAVFQEGYYSHSFAVALLGQMLANHMNLESKGEAFIAGVLHDIGKLILHKQLGPEYDAIYRETGGCSMLLCVKEQESVGFTHADAAAALADHWNFPKTLSDAIWLHHPAHGVPLSAAKDPQLASAIRIANLAIREDWPQNEAAQSKTLQEAEAWACLEDAPVSLPPDSREETLTALVTEARNSPVPMFA